MKKSSSQKGSSEKKVRYNSSTPKEQNQDKEPKEAGERELEEEDSSGHIQSLSDSTIPKVLNSKEPDISQPQTAREFNEVGQSKAKIESIPKRASSKGISKLLIYIRVRIGIHLPSFGRTIVLRG